MSDENATLEEAENKTFMPVDVGTFDEAEEKANYILPPGQYKVRINNWGHGQGAKAQYVYWDLHTIDCPDVADNDQFLRLYTPIEGPGFNIYTNFCRAVGVKWEGTQITPEFCNSLVGSELEVETSIENYMGDDRPKVKNTIAASSAY